MTSTIGNLDPSLENAWHPVALSRELRPGGWRQVRLLGRTWTLRRDGEAVSVEPPASGVREGLGLIWLAPAEPADVPLDVPEAADRRNVASWPVPVRSPVPAGPLADAFLDTTLGPFVHGATVGTPDQVEVTAPHVSVEAGGFSAVQEQWCDNPLDPDVATGGRLLRRRTTHTYRAPFQLRLRQEFLDSGATTTVICLLQPEDLDSTRIYVMLMLASGPGMPLPAPADVAAQAAVQHAILEEDVRSRAALGDLRPPPDRRDDVNVPADRLRVAVRQALCDFLAAGRGQEAAA